jgi:hypothetical protein
MVGSTWITRSAGGFFHGLVIFLMAMDVATPVAKRTYIYSILQ